MQMGVVEGQPLLNTQRWEEVRRQGSSAIENWIDTQMKNKRAVVVLVGAKTADRPWVRYEITKAWSKKHPLVGIRIHRTADSGGNTDTYGANPFARVPLANGKTVADYVQLHNPAGTTTAEVYNTIKANLEHWVQNAYRRP